MVQYTVHPLTKLSQFSAWRCAIELPPSVFHDDFFPIVIFGVGMANQNFIDGQFGVAGVDS